MKNLLIVLILFLNSTFANCEKYLVDVGNNSNQLIEMWIMNIKPIFINMSQLKQKYPESLNLSANEVVNIIKSELGTENINNLKTFYKKMIGWKTKMEVLNEKHKLEFCDYEMIAIIHPDEIQAFLTWSDMYDPILTSTFKTLFMLNIITEKQSDKLIDDALLFWNNKIK